MRNVRKAKTGTTKQPNELTRGLGQLMRTELLDVEEVKSFDDIEELFMLFQ